jgi:glutathione S-transferase
MAQFILYGMPMSLYTGKARSYLIKQKIDFEERSGGAPEYVNDIASELGRVIVPTMKTPEGEIIQDGTDIIDWFENRNLARIPAYPKAPRQKVLSLIFEMFGGEGLLRPAMHYRWNFDETNLSFLTDQFGRMIFPTMSAEERAEITPKAQGRMRKAAAIFGAVPETFDAIEAAYEEFLDRANEHFLTVPYWFGGVPTIGDYGMIASLYAHLGRDPYPANQMKARAPALYRWVERMQTRRNDTPEFLAAEPELPANDAIPETLGPVLDLIARDYVPEVKAMVAFTNDWLASDAAPEPGSIVGGDPKMRVIGMCEFEWQGVTIKAGVFPYRFYLLGRIQDAFDALNDSEKTSVRQLLAGHDLEAFIDERVTRTVSRKDNREIWA